MIAQDTEAQIVNTASLAGLNSAGTLFGTSKFAVVGLRSRVSYCFYWLPGTDSKWRQKGGQFQRFGAQALRRYPQNIPFEGWLLSDVVG